MRGSWGGDSVRVRAACGGFDAQEEITFLERRFAFAFIIVVEAWQQLRQAWIAARWEDAETGVFQKA